MTRDTCRECGKTLRGTYARCKRCRACEDAHWVRRASERSLEEHIAAKCKSANARSRYKNSTGPPITTDELIDMWEKNNGKCANCRRPLTHYWHPRKTNEDCAVVDRVDTTENKSYGFIRDDGTLNAQWMCHACNTEKSGWDIVDQCRAETEAHRKVIAALRAACGSACDHVS